MKYRVRYTIFEDCEPTYVDAEEIVEADDEEDALLIVEEMARFPQSYGWFKVEELYEE